MNKVSFLLEPFTHIYYVPNVICAIATATAVLTCIKFVYNSVCTYTYNVYYQGSAHCGGYARPANGSAGEEDHEPGGVSLPGAG